MIGPGGQIPGGVHRKVDFYCSAKVHVGGNTLDYRYMAAKGRRMAYEVFVSHAYKDRWIARHMVKEMESMAKGRVTVFLDEKDIEVGRPIAKEVRKAIKQCDEGPNWRPKLRKELEHADIFVALLTPWSVTDSLLLQEIGAAWALEKTIASIVTRRDVLNNFPIALDPLAMIEINYLDRLEEPENADKFIRAFENALTATRLSVGKST